MGIMRKCIRLFIKKKCILNTILEKMSDCLISDLTNPNFILTLICIQNILVSKILMSIYIYIQFTIYRLDSFITSNTLNKVLKVYLSLRKAGFQSLVILIGNK